MIPIYLSKQIEFVHSQLCLQLVRGIEREQVGDIIVNERIQFVLTSRLESFIMLELQPIYLSKQIEFVHSQLCLQLVRVRYLKTLMSLKYVDVLLFMAGQMLKEKEQSFRRTIMNLKKVTLI
jgi:RNA-binding protein YlmH